MPLSFPGDGQATFLTPAEVAEVHGGLGSEPFLYNTSGSPVPLLVQLLQIDEEESV